MAYPTDLAYLITDPIVGTPPINSHITATGGTPAVPCGIQPLNFIGKRVRAVDLGASARGEGEFIYLNGLAATAAGEAVVYDEKAATTKRGVAGDRGPVAIAMSACVAGEFGWYQISGSAVVLTGTVAANKPLFWTATPGTLDDAVVATDKIEGLVSKAADSGGYTVCQVSRPSANGNG